MLNLESVVMKKFIILSVMLFCAVTSFAQALPEVLSIKDALTIYKDGFGEAKAKMAELGYEFYGYDNSFNHWAKNCEYSNDLQKAINFGKGISSVVAIPDDKDDVTITVFNKATFIMLKGQIVALGYKVTDQWGGSSGNYTEVYSKKGSPNITASDESADSDMPYNILISNE